MPENDDACSGIMSSISILACIPVSNRLGTEATLNESNGENG